MTILITIVLTGLAWAGESNTPHFQEKPGTAVIKKHRFPVLPILLGAGAIVAAYMLFFKKKPENNNNNNQNKKATMTMLGYDSQPLTSGQVTTDTGTYSVGANGVVNVEYKSSLEAKLYSGGFIQRASQIENAKKYIMIPSEWDAFYSDNQIAGTNGTHKFGSSVKPFIVGDTSDPDYARAKASFEKIVGDTVPYQWVTDQSQANFLIYLNMSESNHGEQLNGGLITKTTVQLIDGASNGLIDEENAQGLVHAGAPSVVNPTGKPGCIEGSLQGWNESVDRPIIRAIYNRSNSTFNNTMVEKEHF